MKLVIRSFNTGHVLEVEVPSNVEEVEVITDSTRRVNVRKIKTRRTEEKIVQSIEVNTLFG